MIKIGYKHTHTHKHKHTHTFTQIHIITHTNIHLHKKQTLNHTDKLRYSKDKKRNPFFQICRPTHTKSLSRDAKLYTSKFSRRNKDKEKEIGPRMFGDKKWVMGIYRVFQKY